jgi:hypothetical protein
VIGILQKGNLRLSILQNVYKHIVKQVIRFSANSQMLETVTEFGTVSQIQYPDGLDPYQALCKYRDSIFSYSRTANLIITKKIQYRR